MQRTTHTTHTANDQIGLTSTDDWRIYAQMRPNDAGVKEMQAIQATLRRQPQGRTIGADELHMTLIHFGKTSEVFEGVRRRHDIRREQFDEQLTRYVTRTTALLPTTPMRLTFDSFSLFGPKRTALVARFIPTDELGELHAKLVGVLVDFFKGVGVPDPLGFMADDPNFRHALTCSPHVTLFKGYIGDMPAGQLDAMRFETMDVLY